VASNQQFQTTDQKALISTNENHSITLAKSPFLHPKHLREGASHSLHPLSKSNTMYPSGNGPAYSGPYAEAFL